MRKILVCMLILQFKGSCFFQLQIFTTTHIVFGFNRWACVWGKLTPMKWDVFMSYFVTLKVSGVKLPQWNGPFSQSFTQCQKRVCHSPKFYPRPPKNLHRYICRICDIMQLWIRLALSFTRYVVLGPGLRYWDWGRSMFPLKVGWVMEVCTWQDRLCQH